jgi:hypothetical protein
MLTAASCSTTHLQLLHYDSVLHGIAAAMLHIYTAAATTVAAAAAVSLTPPACNLTQALIALALTLLRWYYFQMQCTAGTALWSTPLCRLQG